MEIHVFIAHMGIGGAERVCVSLANEWAGLGHRVHICVLNLKDDINTQNLDKSVCIHELGVSRIRYSILPMIRYIKKYKPASLLVFGTEMAVILDKLKKMGIVKCRLVVRVLNNINISLDKEDNVSPMVEKYLKSARKCFFNMDDLIAQCEDMKQQLLSMGIDSNKIHVLYNPVSNVLLHNIEKERIRNKSNLDSGIKVKEITFLGRLAPQKNPLDIIEAFSMVHKKLDNVILRFVGSGVLEDKCRELVTRLGLGNYIFFEGICSDCEKFYAKSSLVVLSSEYEGMPNTLIESIGAGIPVVSYDCPIGPREIINESNGYLVPIHDKEGLARAIEQAINNCWDREAIVQSCKKFRVENIAPKYLEIFAKYENDNN